MKRALLLIALAGCGKSEPTTPATTKPRTIAEIDAAYFEEKAKRDEAEKADPKRSVETLAALHLWNAYYDNELGADGKYRDKYVTITGYAGKTGRDAVGKPFIQFGQNLASGATPPAVVCVIAPGNESSFGKIKEGETISVVGKVIGRKSMPDTFEGFIVVLHDATLIKQDRQDSGITSPMGKKGK